MSWSPRTKSLVAAALLLATGFSVGVVVGVWGTSKVMTQFLNVSPNAPGLSDYFLDDLEADLARQLDLTPAERAAVAAEMRATVVLAKQLRAETTLRLRAIFSDATERMASRMAPEKAVKFREMTERRFRRFGLGELIEERKPATK